MVYMTHMDRVPGCNHYSLRYLGVNRVHSYAHQLAKLVEVAPSSVMEVGPGPGIVTKALQAVGVPVVSVEVQSELAPTVVGSVTDLPFHDRCFDAALCCQVLEHLPFNLFDRAIAELWRVCRKRLVVSLPDTRRFYELKLRLPKCGLRYWTLHLPRDPGEAYRQRVLAESGHYWEIGYREYPYKRIRRVIEKVTGVTPDSWSVPEMKYHRFFMLTRPDTE